MAVGYGSINFPQARFANLTPYGDDRIASIRGCALQMTSGDERWDLAQNTGLTCAFHNAPSLAMSARAAASLKPDSYEGAQAWLYGDPMLGARPSNWFNTIECQRKNFSSYTALRYQTKFPHLIKDETGKEFYCKFRTVPIDKTKQEEGLLTVKDQKDIFRAKTEADTNDPKDKDYLMKELRNRINEGISTEFRLEMTFIAKEEEGLPQIFFHPDMDWGAPWRGLAVVRLTGNLDDHQMKVFAADLGGNLPEGLSVPVPASEHDPRWVLWARSKLYPMVATMRLIQQAALGNQARQTGRDVEVEYQVTVQTGKMIYAGTDQLVEITIVGDKDGVKGTKYHKLDKFFANDHESGSTETYTIRDIDVGTIKLISLKLQDSLSLNGDKDWYLDKVIVQTGPQLVIFPHYQWVNGETENPLVVLTNSSLLPQQESSLRLPARTLQVAQGKRLTTWSHQLLGNDVGDSIPGFLHVSDPDYDALNRKYAWYENHYRAFKCDKFKLMANVLKEVALDFLAPSTSFDDFKDVVDSFSFKEVSAEMHWIHNWESDIEFGRQTLNGMNPICIQRVRAIPGKFPVTDLMVRGLLKRGLTLEEEAAAGHIYMVDHRILEGVATGWEGGALCDPVYCKPRT